jgi:AmmeMemoRadiSam system protein A
MNAAQRESLLGLARRTIECKLREEPAPPPGVNGPETPIGGVFVSLHNRHRLRGCIGRLEPGRLDELVWSMALAVLRDPRFSHHPVTLPEMTEILIELSILSAMYRTSQPLEMEVGVHGIYVRRGASAGCFLPQVALHMQWNSEQMLSRCCQDKAGLDPDAWRDPDTEVYLFTAEVFAEPPR